MSVSLVMETRREKKGKKGKDGNDSSNADELGITDVI